MTQYFNAIHFIFSSIVYPWIMGITNSASYLLAPTWRIVLEQLVDFYFC